MAEHIDILFEETEHGGPGKYVGVENKGGCDPGLGKWIKRNDGFWALRIKEDEWPTVNYSNKTSKTSSNLLTGTIAKASQLIGRLLGTKDMTTSKKG